MKQVLPAQFAREPRYLICFARAHGDLAVWWCGQSEGYTTDLNEAHLYSEQEASMLCDGVRDFMVDPDVLVSVQRTIVQVSKLDLERLLAKDCVNGDQELVAILMPGKIE